jgi:hypothetical protein
MSETVLTNQEESLGLSKGGEPVGTEPDAAPQGQPPGGESPSAGDPTSKTSWIDALPEEMKSSERLTRFKSTAELAEAFLATELPVIPEEADYKIPEGFDIPEFAKWAAQKKLTQEQVDAIVELNTTYTEKAVEALESENKRGLEMLFAEWGGEKDTNIRLAKQFIAEYDTEGKLSKLLDETRAGNNPVVVSFFANVGRALMGEDTFRRRSGGPAADEKSTADLLFDKSVA